MLSAIRVYMEKNYTLIVGRSEIDPLIESMLAYTARLRAEDNCRYFHFEFILEKIIYQKKAQENEDDSTI